MLSDRIESALRELLSEEVVQLTKQGRGGLKCWPAVILDIAARQSRQPPVPSHPAPRHPLAHLIMQILDFRQEVPENHRTAVIRFCRAIVGESRGMELGRLHHLRIIVKPFAEEVLKLLGEQRVAPHLGKTLGRNLTVQQLGLNRREALCYTSLLELGSSKTGAIVKKTGIPSSKRLPCLPEETRKGESMSIKSIRKIITELAGIEKRGAV